MIKLSNMFFRLYAISNWRDKTITELRRWEGMAFDLGVKQIYLGGSLGTIVYVDNNGPI